MKSPCSEHLNSFKKTVGHDPLFKNKFMQKLIKKNITIDILLFLSIISIPLYQIRVNIFITSLSLLSLAELILIMFGIFIYRRELKIIYLKEKYFFNLILSLLAILLLSVLKTNTIHAYGIFIEWFLLPILASFIILIYLRQNENKILLLKKMITFIFFAVSVVALFYWFKKDLTFDDRLKTFYLSPNHLAMFISSTIFIVFSLIYEIKNKLIKILLAIIILIGILILFKTNSIINLLAVFMAINIYLIYFYRKSFILIVSIFLTISLIFISVQHKIPNVETVFKKNSGSSRLVIYTVSLNLARKNLFIGKNLGNFQNKYLAQQQFYPPYPEWAVPTPHNFILMNLFSGGLIFTILFILIIVYWIFKMFIKLGKAKNKQKIIFLYILTILVIIIQGIFDTPYWKNDLSFIFWIVIILGLSEKSFLKLKT
ncbi:MAG: O-antigen ligase family protein [Candidatus Moranbacteria bacterium]|nr:O-antigen ligase family protein [Candidatus Moranbacteria bacterium]